MEFGRAAICLLLVAAVQCDFKIGVKRKAVHCPRKSKTGDILYVHYKGLLSDGKQFDSSHARDEPFAFTIGAGQVIEGWEKGLIGMCETEVRKLTVPPELAYGTSGVPPVIPPDATLTFEVELISIERPEKEL